MPLPPVDINSVMRKDSTDSNVVLVGASDHSTIKLNESFDEFKNRQRMKAGDVDMGEVLKIRASDGHAYTLTEIADAALANVRTADENWRTVVNIPQIRSDSPLILAWGGQDGEPYRIRLDMDAFEQLVQDISGKVAEARCWEPLIDVEGPYAREVWHKLFDAFLPYIVDRMLQNPEMVAQLADAIRLRWAIMPTGAAQGGGWDVNPYEGMI